MNRVIFSFFALIAIFSFNACEGGFVSECPMCDACSTCMTDQDFHCNDIIEDVSVVDVPMVDVGKDIPNDVAKDVPKDIAMEDHCPWHCPDDMGYQNDVGGQDVGQDDLSVDAGESECQTQGDCYNLINGNLCIMAECQVNNGIGKCYFYELENYSPCGGGYYCYEGWCIPNPCDDNDVCTVDFLDENYVCVHDLIDSCCISDEQCNDGLGCQAFSCENYECIFNPEPNCMPPPAICEVDADCVGRPYGPYCIYSEIDKQSYCAKCYLDKEYNVNVGCEVDRPHCFWGIGTDVNQTNFSQYWCAQCVHEGDCNDGNGCTKDICDYTDADWARGVGAICRHEMMDGCQACQTVVDCEDSNPCTIDNCVAGKCNFEVIESCCTADEDCASMVDGDCENFACVENACECLDNDNPLIQCEIACPTKYPYAVVWYASRTTYLENKPAVFEQFMDELCTWAPDFPIFEFNCTNAVDIWADGNMAEVHCNYPFVNNPHPVEGDYGKRVISFPGLDCSP